MGNRRMGLVAIYPDVNNNNPFIQQLSKATVETGYSVVPHREILEHPKAKEPEYLLLNWFDEIKGSSVAALARLVKRRIMVRRYLARGVRVVTFIHNRYPHDRGSLVSKWASGNMRAFLCRKSNAIVGLCRETEEVLRCSVGGWDALNLGRKFHVVPHPDYSGHYALPADYTHRSRRDDAPFTFLLVGNIRRYKNIELVLAVGDLFEEEGLDARVIIAGKCAEPGYVQELEDAAPDNVEVHEGYVSEEDMARLVESADVLILPYDRSSLNSGVCILAFTLGRTVICPEIGTLEDIPASLVYKYTYSNESDHLRNLAAAARRAYDDKAADKNALVSRGRELRGIVTERNSLDVVGKKLANIFSEIETQRDARV